MKSNPGKVDVWYNESQVYGEYKKGEKSDFPLFLSLEILENRGGGKRVNIRDSSTFSLRSTTLCSSNRLRPRTKIVLRNVGYKTIPKIENFDEVSKMKFWKSSLEA